MKSPMIDTSSLTFDERLAALRLRPKAAMHAAAIKVAARKLAAARGLRLDHREELMEDVASDIRILEKILGMTP